MDLHIKKILVPVDFSENSLSALRYARTFAGVFGAELLLVYVLEPIIYPPDFSLGQITLPSGDLHEIDTRAREEIKKLAEEENALGIKTNTFVKTGKPFIEIIDLAKEEDVDLIIIASHGHTGVEHILFGSTSEKIVRKAPCPVLTVRDPIKGFDYRSVFKKE